MPTTETTTDRWKDFAPPPAGGEEPEQAVLVDYLVDGHVALITLNRPHADNAITTALMADDAVNTAEIADDAITNALMADNAIGTAELADDAVTNAELSAFLLGVGGPPPAVMAEPLREIAEKAGIPGYLVDGPEDLQREWFEGKQAVGVTAGASAPRPARPRPPAGRRAPCRRTRARPPGCSR